MSTSQVWGRALALTSLLAGCGDDIASATDPSTSSTSSTSSTDPTTSTTTPPVPTTTTPDETSSSSTGPAVSASSTSSTTGDPDLTTSTSSTSTGDPSTTSEPPDSTTTTDSTTSETTTTGVFLGCQEPTDSDTAADPTAWSRQVSTDISTLDARRMEVDHTGAVILSDIFYGLIDLGGAPLDGTGESTHHFLVKYDATGAHDWSLDFGGLHTGFEEYDLALDCAGNLFLAGSFYGPMTIDGVTLEATFGTVQQGDIIYATTDILVAKFSPGGQLVWARSFGDKEYQRAHDLVTTDAGGLVLVGALQGTLEIDGAVIVADDSYDGLLLELDDEGEYRGHRSFAAPADVAMQVIDRSAGGQLTVLGNAAADVDFGGGPLPAPNQNYLYIAQFEQNGDHRWSLRGPEGQFVFGVASDDDAAVYLIGNKSKTAILTRYDPTGAITWTRTGPSTHSAIPYDIGVTGTTIAIAGTFRYSIDFGDGNNFSSNTGNDDMFLVRYATDGALLSASQVVSGDKARPRRVRVGPDGETVVAGHFEGPLDLPTGQLAPIGAQDIFLHRAAP